MSKTRFLVIRGGAIGDFICTLPAIGALRERWPDAHIEVLGYPHITALAQDRHYADATRSVEAQAMARFFVPQAILDPGWVDYFASFDVVVSYLFDPDEIFAGNVRRCRGKQYIAGSPRPSDLPAARHYCRPLEALALYVDNPIPRVFPNAADRAAARRFLSGLGQERFAVVHPGSGGERKNWPSEKFAAVARWLMDELGLRLVVVKGEADERAVTGLLAGLGLRTVTLATGLRLAELAAVLAEGQVFVGNDSGITHLAAAVGTPTVAVFGPASSAIWEPVGEKVRVVAFGEGDTGQVRGAVAGLLV